MKNASLSISVFDEDGAFLETIAPAPATGATDTANEFSVAQPDGADVRDWTVTIDSLAGAARTIKLRVAEKVASSDVFDDNATAKTDHTITLLGANPGIATDAVAATNDTRCFEDCPGR